MSRALRFAHLSDWHATTLVGAGREVLLGKRLSGWASWALKRRRHHSPEILAAAIRDVRAQDVDRILVTGDLTHVSLESEFRTAARQLAALGTPEEVFLIPGNHDCYVPVAPERSWDHWAAYLQGVVPEGAEAALAEGLGPAPAAGRAPRHADYPTLRLAGEVAFVGLCSSIATPVFRAGGQLGPDQLERLELLLDRLGRDGRCRVVMIHHPITLRGDSARRALWDGEALRGVLSRSGAELVLHGHKHRRRVDHVTGPDGPIPVIGVPSSSEVGSRPDRPAQYHVYSVTSRAAEEGGGFALRLEIRGYDAARGEFDRVEVELL